MNKKCQGCGAILQSTNPNIVGYIPKEKDQAEYCERCYKIIHYNEKKYTSLPNINKYILEEVNKKADYVYFMIDILNINEETISTYRKIKIPKSLIISKLDIIPKDIKKEKIKLWLQEVYNIKEKIIFQSTKKNINTNSLINNLEENNIKNCYILGYTNSGKSTLINKLCNTYKSLNKQITTSSIPNTTIDFIKIKLNDEYTIIDSPGFTLEKAIYQEDDYDLITRLSPKKFLKPITYQTKENTIINIENLIQLTPQNENSLTLYISNEINTERIYKVKKALNFDSFNLNIDENSDIVIKSVGFINVKKACQIKIQINDKSLIEVRPSLFQKRGE